MELFTESLFFNLLFVLDFYGKYYIIYNTYLLQKKRCLNEHRKYYEYGF